MKQQFFNAFLKGIDERVSETSGDEVRFRQLQNVRLQKRGATGSITRMSGYERIASQYNQSDTFLDALFYKNFLFILYTRSGSTYVDIYDVESDPITQQTITIASSAPTYAELTLLDDTIFITALEKQLNYINNNFILNDFISTIPTLTVATSSTLGTLDQNEDYWYKVRHRYYDGHKTVTSNPQHVNTSTNTSINLTITALQEDLDGGWIDIEIFRRKGTQDYFKIDRITPDSSGYTVSSGTFTYEDTGKSDLDALTDQSYVWAATSDTQSVVRDRLVKANNTYLSSKNNSVLSINKNEITVNTTEQGIPFNTEVEVFNQVTKEDGTKSLFTSQGSIETDSDDARLQSRLSTPYSSTNNLKEIATYARFRPKTSNDVISFDSFEIYNSNVASITTAGESAEDKPTNPHIFLGWKYLSVQTGDTYARVYDQDWDASSSGSGINNDYFNIIKGSLNTNPIEIDSTVLNVDIETPSGSIVDTATPYSKFAQYDGLKASDSFTVGTQATSNGNITITYRGTDYVFAVTTAHTLDEIGEGIINALPNFTGVVGAPSPGVTTISSQYGEYDNNQIITIDVASTGVNLTKTTLTLSLGVSSSIYRFAYYDALQEAIRQGKCYVTLKRLDNVSGLSSSRPDTSFIDLKVKVVGLKDTSIGETQIIQDSAKIYPTSKNHLYLILESGTFYDDFDSTATNNNAVKDADFPSNDPNITTTYGFELNGFLKSDKGTFTQTSPNDWVDINYDYNLILTDYTDFSNDSAVFLKTQTTNEIEGSLTTPNIQGWTKTINNKFEFYSINEWNEYATIVTEEDILQQFDQDFPNQLIWSGTYLRNSASNAIRNFDYTNVKYISGRFGNIIKISYILGKLIVFCERGINIVNVGEVLTRQTSGQTFVDSSSLLNDDYWVLENLQDVKAKSVVKHENKLFFCDGYDVWMYNGEFKNLTDGRITLDNTKDYIGSYDPRNKEYHLSDGEGTFTYSLELGEWTGKHTFSMLIAEHRKNNFYGVVSYTDSNNVTEIVPAVMNTNNDFDGRSFSSVIDSVAQYTQMPTGIKKFRKFYTDLGLFTGANSFDESYDITSYDGEENTRLEYGNDGNTYTSVNLGTKKVANGFVHVGIDGSRSTGYYLYWKLITSDPNLQLNSIGLLYMLKNRL